MRTPWLLALICFGLGCDPCDTAAEDPIDYVSCQRDCAEGDEASCESARAAVQSACVEQNIAPICVAACMEGDERGCAGMGRVLLEGVDEE